MATSYGAHAHHSYSMFDGRRPQTVRGTVAKLEWRNPHVMLWITVPQGATGTSVLYGLEASSVNLLTHIGWSRNVLKPGDLVVAELFPLRDGRPGGHLISASLQDGRIFRNTSAGIEQIRSGMFAPTQQVAP
jgi:hypothetical protein